MTNKELVLDTLRRSGKLIAADLQNRSPDMTGTELNAEASYIPEFQTSVKKRNMLDRPAGFVCRSSTGRVVKLLQPYDSTIYIQEPEELPAQWSFVWSDDPAHARPFVAISTSPYMAGNCCTENGTVYRSRENNNVFPPSAYPAGWEVVA